MTTASAPTVLRTMGSWRRAGWLRRRSPIAFALAALLVTTACGGGGTAATSPVSTPSAEASASPAATVSPSPSPAPSVAPPSVAADGTVTIEVSNWPPGIMLAGDDAMWISVSKVTSIDIFRIDPETNEPARVLADLPPEQIASVGLDGSVWVVSWDSSSVTEYDAATGEQLGNLPVGDSPIEPVVAFGDLWTLNHHGGSVTRIDTATSSVVATIDVANTGPAGPLSYAIAGDLLWVAAPNTPVLVAIDPETNEIAHTLDLPLECSPEIAGVGDQVWLWGCQYAGGDVIDARTLEAIGTREELDTALTQPLVTGDRNWVAAVNPQTTGISSLAAVDLDSFAVVDHVPVEPEAGLAVAAFDSMWLTVGPAIRRVPASALAE